MHHLGVGAVHASQVVTILIDADTVTVLHTDTGEFSASMPLTATGTNQRRTDFGATSVRRIRTAEN
jgi:hypothetical protein